MNSKWFKYLTIVIVCLFMSMIVYMAFTYKEVPGADAKISEVVKEYADKAGVEERDPYINTDKGDLLLFLFCFSGLVAGFYLGYNWRKIVSEIPKNQNTVMPKDIKISSNRIG